MAVFAEHLVIHIHKLALTYGGRRLPAGGVLRTLREPELSRADTYRAGGDESYLDARIFNIREYRDKLMHSSYICFSVVVDKRGGSHFDNEPFYIL